MEGRAGLGHSGAAFLSLSYVSSTIQSFDLTIHFLMFPYPNKSEEADTQYSLHQPRNSFQLVLDQLC